MEYEGRICSPPMEISSFMLPVMVGCSYNKCKFCNLFQDVKYRELTLSEIEKELLRVKNIGGHLQKVFLGDGEAFALKTEKLIRILDLIHKYFPKCQTINMDATISSILAKTDDELRILKEKGVNCLYIGIESGLDRVLHFMKKEHTVAQAKKAIERIHKHGYIFGAHIMTGISGANSYAENATAIASFLNKTQPTSIINFSMFLHNEVPLFKDIETGKFLPADELLNLKEEKMLIELLQPDDKKPIYYDGSHDYLGFRVRGLLPNATNKILQRLEDKINEYENKPPIFAYVYGKCDRNLKKSNADDKVW